MSTEGTLVTRYYVGDGTTVTGLTAALDALIADAKRLRIEFTCVGGAPMLYVEQDGEDPDVDLPADWHGLLKEQATRLGWTTYDRVYPPRVRG